MIKKNIGFLMGIFALSLAGCSTTTADTNEKVTADTLANKSFHVISIDNQAIDGAKATMNFTKDNINGRGFCNLYSGSYDVDFRGLFVTKTMSTRRMCPEDLMLKDMKLQKILNEPMRIEKSQLGYTISNEKGSLELLEVEPVSVK